MVRSLGDLGVVARDGVLSATTTNFGGRGETGISCRVDIGTLTVGLRRGEADLSDAEEEEEEAEEEVDEAVRAEEEIEHSREGPFAPRERKDESETAVASEPISLRSFFSSSLTSLSSFAIRKFAVRILTPATADPM